MRAKKLFPLCLLPLLCGGSLALSAQEKAMTAVNIKTAAGDEDPADTKMASLSLAMMPAAIRAAIRTVADWQLQHSEAKFNQDWTYTPLYLSLLTTSETLHDAKCHDAVLRASESFAWKLWATRQFHADDEAIGQAYERLHMEQKEAVRIADTQATFDRLLERPDDPQGDLWRWCAALFMAPAGLARLSAITGNHAYLDRMDRERDLTTAHLCDHEEHFYFRGNSYLGKTEKNGKKIFWGRGNRWALGGLANTLRVLPKNDPLRPKYVALFKEMSERVVGLQQPDGLWYSGLLDQEAYDLPEISGSAFFAYSMAWGVNEGILPRTKYQPAIQKAGAGMLQHVYADGRLGCIQPIGAAPGAFGPTSSYVYGTGAFLLAGAEIDRMAGTAL